jgi:hypothetical protein
MTWVHNQVAVFTFGFEDDDGASSSLTLYGKLPVLAQWTQDAADKVKEEIATLLDALSDAALKTSNALLVSYDDTFPVGAAGSDVEDKGVLLLTTDNNQPGSMAIPSILESKLVDTGLGQGIQINFSDGDVSAFVDAMTTGLDLNPFGIGDTVRFGTSRGENWSVVRDGYKQNRKSQKGRGRRG